MERITFTLFEQKCILQYMYAFLDGKDQARVCKVFQRPSFSMMLTLLLGITIPVLWLADTLCGDIEMKKGI